ncbi:unnamed protein product [Cochlearia groenlandica]
MKFGKRIKEQIQESLPEWRDKFLRYKELKNLISSPAPAESIFIGLLNAEIEKFNGFFVEQEEDFIIHHKELQNRIQRLVEKYGHKDEMFREEIGEIRKDIVNFHGEMVLLVNYSNINYTGIAKILKKFDKRRKSGLRSSFIQKVLKQPFFKTDLVSRLVREWETMMDAVFPVTAVAAAEGYERSEAVSSATAGEGIFRNTVAALLTMREMRRGSSTYGVFSLPPLNFSDSDLVLRSICVPSPIPIPY